jgi:Flp pilus assembly protein TadD
MAGAGRVVALASAILLAGCSLPRIVVLHDPLTAEEHWQLGVSYARDGERERAEQEYRQALKQKPDDPRIWSSLGHLHQSDGRTVEAERAYRRAIEIDPSFALAHNNLAWLYAEQAARLPEAENHARRALAVDPDRRAVYLDTLAYVQFRAGRMAEAETTIREAEALAAGTAVQAEIARTKRLILQDRADSAHSATAAP